MAISPGRRLGPYEILSAIGAGGMGEVYRARDTRLDRMVAIKILPDHLSGRENLRERFEREAKTIASLNHPHICTLFDTGHQDDIDFLVMEYIEGETLAQRLTKGPLPLQQVLQYAIEIADALDKAHRKGITHRDLKPGNIMLTKSGTKLLDFGLAKLAQDSTPVTPESQLPTMKDAITAQGTILGTLQYMAPEQVEGKEVDARTDIFAFGVVVYEMATGKKAFEGKSQASVMAKILETDPPPMTTLAPMTPPSLDRVVKRCLAKDPDDRWQSARDLCEELHWISDTSQQSAATGPTMQRRPTDRVAWAVAAIAALVAVVALGGFFLRRPPLEEKQVVRFTIGPPQNGSFASGIQGDFSISPDGAKLAFIASAVTGGDQLWVRALDSPSPTALAGTTGAYDPFWSPDSQFIGFFAEGKLKKVALSGGPVQALADAPNSGEGTWSRDGVILFAGAGGEINRVSESGGSVTVVATRATMPQSAYGAQGPHFLPDGKHFLYYALSTTPGDGALYAATLDFKDQKLILKMNSNVVYVSPGYLLYQEQGTIMAQPFDANRLQLMGDPKPIGQGVAFNPFGGTGLFAASDNGVLAYRVGGGAVPLSLVWVSRSGAEQQLPAPPHNYTFPRISPDGQRVAIGMEEGGGQIWLYDIARDASSRLTFEGSNFDPIWTPDGKHVTFKGKGNRLFWQLANGGGTAEELLSSPVGGNSIPGSWSPDGKELAFLDGGAVRNIYILPLQDRKPHVFAESQTYESAPSFSPDGKWMVYVSNESGRNEVYVRPYPGPGGRWQISTDGGTEPVWNPKGRELFYRQAAKMMAVDYQVQPTFSAGKPHMLFEGSFTPSPRSAPDYDVSPDGQRFLMLKAGQQSEREISIVLNWPEELKQKPGAGGK